MYDPSTAKVCCQITRAAIVKSPCRPAVGVMIEDVLRCGQPQREIIADAAERMWIHALSTRCAQPSHLTELGPVATPFPPAV